MKEYYNENQKIQEDQYSLPYHYILKKHHYSGLFYFSYIDKCQEIIYSYKDKKVLDAGCGDGFFLKKIINSGNYVYGVDYSNRALNFARLLSGCDNLIHDDISTLEKIEDESFDIVTNIAVIEHIKPELVDKTINTFYRILKKDGILIMAIPTPNLRLISKHFQHFSIKKIKDALSRFEIKKIYGANRFSPFFRLFCSFFSNRFISSPWIFDNMIGPIYNKFFKSCNPQKATMAIVIAKK